MIPEGNYPARAKTWTYRESQNKNWYLSVTFEIRDAEHAGQQVKGALNFTNENQERASHAAMQLMGWPGGDLMSCHDNGGNLDRNEVEVVVRHDQFNGRNFAKVERVVLSGVLDAEREALRQFINSRAVRPPPAAPPPVSSIDKGNV